ncbi:putative type II/type IV pathway secretion protein [marine actinobacterium PHSC20C1]|nr:putative type II/type IV pathway secretion protein [marine actinobacterium PHSC20C1]
MSMSNALATIADQVRQRVRRDGVDLSRDSELASRYVRDEVRRYSERALGGSVPLLADEGQTAREVVAALTGYGPLQPYFDDDSVEELWINGPEQIFVARNGVPEFTGIRLTDSQVRDLVERMLQTSGRRVDLSSPFVDASLPDGSRLHVVIPDVTRRHWAVNVRKFSQSIRDLDRLVELGSLPQHAADYLRLCVLSGQNIVVSGATQSGKTTMLNALLAAGRPTERVVTVEETFELSVVSRDSVGMQCRQPSLEGTGEISLRRLIKEALRMRPDRLVVGEVRDAESLDLLIALNSGLPGMSSIHANSAREALVKLCTLPLLAGRNIDSSFVVPTVASSVDVVVHCELTARGTRRVVEILSLTGAVSDGVIDSSVLFRLSEGALLHTGAVPARLAKFHAAGIDPVAHLLTAVA